MAAAYADVPLSIALDDVYNVTFNRTPHELGVTSISIRPCSLSVKPLGHSVLVNAHCHITVSVFFKSLSKHTMSSPQLMMKLVDECESHTNSHDDLTYLTDSYGHTLSVKELRSQ